MTIFSLGSACDLEHFSNNTKLDNLENFQMDTINAPVVPMPTDPPFGDTKYQWKSESAMTRDMTTRNVHSNTFQPSVGMDSQGWGTVQNYGGDYWGTNSNTYNFDNKLLNNQHSEPAMMPGMKQQGTYMPPARAHIVQKEDFNGRDRDAIIKQKILAIKAKMEEEVELPEFPKEKMMGEQKTAWIALIVIFLVVIFTILYKAKIF